MHIAVAPMNIGTGSHIFAAAEAAPASEWAVDVSVTKLISHASFALRWIAEVKRRT
jgi:hypothetical protein